MLDREKLAKVLALMTSPNDWEALAAARRAGHIIAEEGLTWDEVLARPAGQSNMAVHIDLFRRGEFASPEFYKDGEEWRIRVKR